MIRATLRSCSMRSRSRTSCSTRCPLSLWPVFPCPTPRRSCPHYAVDLDAPVGNLRAGRRNAHKLPSIVGGVRHEAVTTLSPVAT